MKHHHLIFLFITLITARNYVIMIDAGSSGSRLHVYTYLTNVTGVPSIFEAPLLRKFEERSWNIKVTPGLGAFVMNVTAIYEYLDQLLDFARVHIPRDQIERCPVFLFGTAGLRQIPRVYSEEILEAVRDHFEGSGFRFERDWARIISGAEEGAFGWITVNHLFQTFGNVKVDSYGALDMGGASTQVTFEPASIPPNDYGFNFTLADRTYTLYDNSFLGFGLDRARNAKTIHLIEVQKQEIIQDGCLPVGYSENFEYLGKTYILKGTNDPKSCYAAAKAVLNLKPDCSKCTIDGQFLPTLKGKFVAFSGYYFTGAFLNLTEVVSPGHYYSAGFDFCKLNYATLEANFRHNTISWPYITQYCFQSMYISTVLIDAYNIQENDKRIIIANEVQNIELSWTMGATLFEIIQLIDN